MTSALWLPQPAAVPSPAELAAYLRQKGWSLKTADARWALYAKPVDGEEIVFEVPQLAAAPDFARVVGFLLDDIARFEQRNAASVLRDVKASSVDIVRLSIEGSSTRDGRIPVEAGHRVYDAARDLLLAAACSVIDPRPAFAKRKPEEAMSLLGRARFGQTEIGSFVLTMECAIAPRLQQPMPGVDNDPDAPFERKTCLRLAHALTGAERAARQSAASGRLDPFRDRVKDGVSANLCEAVAEVLEATSADALRAGFSFASSRPLLREVPSGAAFSADIAAVLREASTQLREEASYPATEIVGTIVGLKSDDSAAGGGVDLRVHLEGRQRKVRVSLEPAAYQEALTAHRDGALVRCLGDLEREGRSWVLRNPRDFRTCLENEEQ
jgi:hypothetical protein